MKHNIFSRLSNLSLIIFTIFILTSCGSIKDVAYFQDPDQIPSVAYQHDMAKYEIRIMPNDNLLITVSALNPQAAEPFNAVNLTNRSVSTSGLEWQGYLVDEKGEINFPVVGKLRVGGLIKSEAISLIQKRISQYIDDPVVNIRFMNYKVSVLGEVNRPGSYTITDEKISISQALALAGDLTIYGKRNDIMVCRVENGEKQFYYVDITSPAIFFSPCYYLQQNDIVYVTPNKSRASSSTYNSNLPLIVSLVSVVITAVALFVR